MRRFAQKRNNYIWFYVLFLGITAAVIGACSSSKSPSSPAHSSATSTYTYTPCTDGNGYTCTPTSTNTACMVNGTPCTKTQTFTPTQTFTQTWTNTPTNTSTVTSTITPYPTATVGLYVIEGQVQYNGSTNLSGKALQVCGSPGLMACGVTFSGDTIKNELSAPGPVAYSLSFPGNGSYVVWANLCRPENEIEVLGGVTTTSLIGSAYVNAPYAIYAGTTNACFNSGTPTTFTFSGPNTFTGVNLTFGDTCELPGISGTITYTGANVVNAQNALFVQAYSNSNYTGGLFSSMVSENGGAFKVLPPLCGGPVYLQAYSSPGNYLLADCDPVTDLGAMAANYENITNYAITLTDANLYNCTFTATPSVTSTPTNTVCTDSNGYTCTPTGTFTPTPTNTACVDSNGYTCTPTPTPTDTKTPTSTFTSTFTHTPTHTWSPTPSPTIIPDASIGFYTNSPLAVQAGVPIPASTNLANSAYGGTSPYYYEVGTLAEGTPPLGTVVDLNGNLDGTPSTVGSNVFDVCAVDSTGRGSCQPVTVDVVSVTVTSIVQTLGTKVFDGNCGDYGNSEYVTITVNGTAAGPVSTYLDLDIAGGMNYTCPSWTVGTQTGQFYRATGQPLSVSFSLQYVDFLTNCNSDTGGYYSAEVVADGYDFFSLNPNFTVFWQ